MQHLTESKAKLYQPATADAAAAAGKFIDTLNAWTNTYRGALRELKEFVSSNAQSKVLGLLASDSLNMSSFGFVFEGNPGPGYIRVPGDVARRIEAQGLRGEGYFPDVGHPLGRELMRKLGAVSRAAEARPLMTGVPGVKPMAVESGRLVLTRAFSTDGQVFIAAAPSALAAENALTPAPEVVAQRAAVADGPAAAKRRMSMS